MFPLRNSVMHYSWGSPQAIPELQGRPASGTPEAELWMGAHPKAPSSALVNGEWLPLDALIRQSPQHLLGERVAGQYGGLPFLFKVLAAAEPLSLQAHPSKAQAGEGFDREEAKGVALSAPERNYRDRNHKPEVLCAVSPFEALCAFRPVPEIRQLLSALSNDALSAVMAPLAGALAGDAEMEQVVARLLHAPASEREALVRSTQRSLSHRARDTPFEAAFVWVEALAARYPDDVGVIISLLLNYVRLAPGEALYVPAGVLHAYLRGTGFELMASSDNVLRGGLTSKHVDPAELLRIMSCAGRAADTIVCVPVSAKECVYRTPAAEFELSRLSAGEDELTMTVSAGPEILLVAEGTATCRTGEQTIHLRQGDSAFVPAFDGEYSIAGPAVLYRAMVPGADRTSPSLTSTPAPERGTRAER